MSTSDEKKAQVQAQFGAHASLYTTSTVHASGDSLGRLVALANPTQDDVVLDIATAAGHNALSFAPHVQHVVGLDLTSQMLSEARGLAHKRAIPNVSFSQGDAEHLPFADDSFTIVTCRIAPHHFPDVASAVREMARVCRPGGCVALCDNLTPEEPDAAAYINAFEMRRDPSHHWAYAREDWRQFFTQAGLTLEAEDTLPKKMHFISWTERLSAAAEVVVELRQELFHAPPAVHAFLKPRLEEQEAYFDLTEGLFIGRK